MIKIVCDWCEKPATLEFNIRSIDEEEDTTPSHICLDCYEEVLKVLSIINTRKTK